MAANFVKRNIAVYIFFQNLFYPGYDHFFTGAAADAVAGCRSVRHQRPDDADKQQFQLIFNHLFRAERRVRQLHKRGLIHNIERAGKGLGRRFQHLRNVRLLHIVQRCTLPGQMRGRVAARVKGDHNDSGKIAVCPYGMVLSRPVK